MGDRADVHRRLREDLIGPHAEMEVLGSRPSDVYLTGILWPQTAGEDPEADDSLGAETGGDDDPGESDAVRASAIARPSAAGVSFAVDSEGGDPCVEIEVRFATYVPREEEGEEERKQQKVAGWARVPRRLIVSPVVMLPAEFGRSIVLAAPEAGIEVKPLDAGHPAPPDVVLHVRSIPNGKQTLVTVTLWNRMVPKEVTRRALEEITLFQTDVLVRPAPGTRLRERPARRHAGEADERAAELLYRHVHEYSAGHTCGADWTAPDQDGHGGEVRTSWMPVATVAAVSSLGDVAFQGLASAGVDPLDAAWLGRADVSDICAALRRLPGAYLNWIAEQERTIASLPSEHRRQAQDHMDTARSVAASIGECIDVLAMDACAAEAFRLANRAMTLQFNWTRREAGAKLRWRPFQLGFVLLAIPSLILRNHADRKTMDLLWFPTGGGKTEAYLALVAFLAFHRRLRNGAVPDDGAGVAAIMRYTLRLLTTQQFERATAMVLACDAIRRTDAGRLGNVPFSIGLWVGGEATPNTYEKAEESLRTGNTELASPKQIVACPACKSKLSWVANSARRRIEVSCTDSQCELSAGELPVWTVDTDVYSERPTLLIGTVDKFAQIARGTAWRSLFAVDGGAKPDLIIQDELHLISGPLGTIAGVYETAIDRLLEVEGVPAKVIGSTATIRRADDQIRAVFDRSARLFPPPGLTASSSGFAVPDASRPGRLFVGVTTAGRSAKFTLQAVAASLLQSGSAAFADDSQADPYRTLVSYFNSLRELGGALVLMQDDVADSIGVYAALRNEPARPVHAVEELTSRRTQAEVRDMLGQLALSAGHPGMLDVVLASNMLSVGVDVPRLGLMLVNGQPKGIAEYIQATSRIGRGSGPGLVVAVLNNAKARDRSHFETFRTWHETLYRDVEATSVTPFAARARDRAIHAALATLVRTLVPGMASPAALATVPDADVNAIRDWIVKRARSIDASEVDVQAELEELLDEWRSRAPTFHWNDYQPNRSLLQSAERVAMRRANGRAPGAAWPTMNNMRSVEPSAHFRLAEGLASGRAGNAGGADGQQ